jgi:hypothetical protein
MCSLSAGSCLATRAFPAVALSCCSAVYPPNFNSLLLLQGPLLEQLLGVAKGMEYLHNAEWLAGDLRAGNVQLAYAQQQQHAAAAAAAAANAAGAASFSSAPFVSSPRVPAGSASQQQQQQQQGVGLARAGSLPCSPQLPQAASLQRAGSLGLAAQQQQQQKGMSRDDSADNVTMRLRVEDRRLGPWQVRAGTCFGRFLR